jgi:hypothetical protein
VKSVTRPARSDGAPIGGGGHGLIARRLPLQSILTAVVSSSLCQHPQLLAHVDIGIE